VAARSRGHGTRPLIFDKTMAGLTVLGIGNILMRDEGVGVRLLEALRQARAWPADVEFVDGGVGGLGLLGVIEQADRLVVLDAADMHLPPGSVRVIGPDQLAAEPAEGRLSLHQMPLSETLRLCEQQLGRRADVRIMAIQADRVEPGLKLSDALASRMDDLVREGVELIEQCLKDTEPPA
jgi:hydrogenase maturation protease